MREKISRTVLRKEHEEKVKSRLEASETACDDTHKFNPSRFDMVARLSIRQLLLELLQLSILLR